MIERAENGERLSVKDVRNLIEEARNKQETETAERLAAREAEIRAEYVRGSGYVSRRRSGRARLLPAVPANQTAPGGRNRMVADDDRRVRWPREEHPSARPT